MNTATTFSLYPAADERMPESVDNGYGRARLLLGIIGVGLWVVVSATLIFTGAAESLRHQLPAGVVGEALIVTMLLSLYVLTQLPLDWLGGYVVPKRFGRRILSAGAYAQTLLRGITVHTAVLLISATVLYLGGATAGLIGAFVAGLIWLFVLAASRGVLAHIVATLTPATSIHDVTQIELLLSRDEGFTGGIAGVVSPRKNILPAAWKDQLLPNQFDLAKARREQIIRSGAWHTGRIGAFVFTAVGLLIALVLSGSAQAGTGVGVVETALWFTLWSFAGLLSLPTLSRVAIYRIDQQLIHDGVDPKRFEQLTTALDRMQDGEPDRSRWVERIFHPIPSVSNRQSCNQVSRLAFWDVARTSVYLGLGAGSLLTRSVHCNVGRPALWVWLPTD